MTILINNKETTTSATTLAALASELALPEKGVAVAVSNAMVPRSEWATTTIADGANIVIIKAACGG